VDPNRQNINILDGNDGLNRNKLDMNDSEPSTNTLISINRIYMKKRDENDNFSLGTYLSANVKVFPNEDNHNVNMLSNFNGGID
jgi:hypothetical protein